MQNIPNDPKAIAEAAIANEIEGHRILNQAKEFADDLRAKATFEFLAEQELRHIELIQNFAKALESGESWAEELKVASPEEIGPQIRRIFERFQTQFEDAAIQPEAHLEVYQVAMDMERRGYDYYSSASKKVTDENARNLFDFLAKEEQRHFEIIQETHQYLSNPEGVLAWEENWMQT